MFATPGLDPGGATQGECEHSAGRSELDIDAEHGSGTADPEGIEFRCGKSGSPLGGGASDFPPGLRRGGRARRRAGANMDRL